MVCRILFQSLVFQGKEPVALAPDLHQNSLTLRHWFRLPSAALTGPKPFHKAASIIFLKNIMETEADGLKLDTCR